MISIIIPVFNGTRTIEKCLKSIVEQSFQKFEIVIVDDGSVDDSVVKIQSFFNNCEKKVKFNLVTQENRGQGNARNTGLKNAKGEYIVFADQDDYFELDLLYVLYNSAKKTSADIVVSGYRQVKKNGKTIKKVKLKNCEWSKFSIGAAWAKIYKKEYLDQNNINFLPVVLGEDIYFLLQAYSKTNKIETISYIGYNWVYNDDSLYNATYKEKKSNILPLLNNIVAMDNFKIWKKEAYYEYFIFKTIIWFILHSARGSSVANNERKKEELYVWLNNYFPNFLNNPYIGLFSLNGEKFYLRVIIWIYKLAIITKLDRLIIYIFSAKDINN